MGNYRTSLNQQFVINSAFSKGKGDFKKGKTRDENPYNKNSAQWTAWEAGWVVEDQKKKGI